MQKRSFERGHHIISVQIKVMNSKITYLLKKYVGIVKLLAEFFAD
jgi:hypothetical protein